MNGRETPTRGRELTMLEQLLGNVGRGQLPRTEDDDPGQPPPATSFPVRPNRRQAPEIDLSGAFFLGRFPGGANRPGHDHQPMFPLASTASSSRATMLVILIIGFTAGPEVSL